MKKVLIITYYWPPSGGAGTQRWLKISKFLPSEGWTPIILTVDPKLAAYPQMDYSLEKDVSPFIEVYKTKATDYYKLYKKTSPQKQIPYGGFSNESNPNLIQKISRFIRGNFFIPDPRIGWNKHAYKKAVDLINIHHPEHIITTGPPHSTHLIGRRLKQNLGVSWIADFRDPWTDIYYNKLLKQSKLARKLNEKLELSVIKEANHILTASKGFKSLLASKASNINEKSLVIYNGFDREDFIEPRHETPGKIIITHSGTIADSYNLDGFIAAIKNLYEVYKDQLIIRFVGKVSPRILNIFVENKIHHLVKEIGYVDHQKSIEYISNSNLLLLVIPDVINNAGIVPGKLFEYMSTKNRILAIGPTNGDVNDLLTSTETGEIFRPNDSQNIEAFIIEEIANIKIKTEKKNLEKFSRKEQTKVLAQHLDSWK